MIEIPLKEKYRKRPKAKKTKTNYSGNSGASKAYKKPPTGLRRVPRRRYG